MARLRGGAHDRYHHRARGRPGTFHAPGFRVFASLLACALLVVAIAGPVACVAAWKMTYATLARDQGTYQYIAWALAQGQRDYVDVRDVSGPLIHFLHLLFLQVGSADEHVFRSIDVLVNAAVFFGTGALLVEFARARAGEGSLGPRGILRWAWGAAATVVLMAQYVRFGSWNTAQRESYYTLFLLLAVALQVWAQGAPDRRRAALVIAGMCSVVTWFGKPTNVIFTVLQATTLAFPGPAQSSGRRGVIPFAAGGAAACALMLALLSVWGDPAAFFRIVLLEIPRMYMSIDRLSWWDALHRSGNWRLILPAAVTIGGLAFGLVARRLPPSMAVLLVLPVGGVVTFFIQSKGFPYHLHPVSSGMYLAWLALGIQMAARTGAVRTPVALAVAALLGILAFGRARNSEPFGSDWPRAGGSAERRAQEAYFAGFQLRNFHAWDLRRAAAFVAANTSPQDRVQTYGIDPYFLFLARRLSATPYLYNFELNVEASLRGGSGGVPSEVEGRGFRRAAMRRQLDLVRRLEERPPEAFVLFDYAPFTYPPDAVVDLEQHAPPVASFLHARYRQAARIGTVRVWFRRDVPVRSPPPP